MVEGLSGLDFPFKPSICLFGSALGQALEGIPGAIWYRAIHYLYNGALAAGTKSLPRRLPADVFGNSHNPFWHHFVASGLSPGGTGGALVVHTEAQLLSGRTGAIDGLRGEKAS